MLPLILIGSGALLWLLNDDKKVVDNTPEPVPPSAPTPDAPIVPSTQESNPSE
jgi:hypothetical protein